MSRSLTSSEFSLHHSNHAWWVVTRSPVLIDRIDVLRGLNHRFLDQFERDFPSAGFGIRQYAPAWVRNRLIDYLLSQPGKEEKERLRGFAGHEVFPVEVVRSLWRQFRPNPTRGNATWEPDAPWQPDPHFTSAYLKCEHSRAKAWDLTCQYGRSAGIPDSDWKKCHTEQFWVWFCNKQAARVQEGVELEFEDGQLLASSIPTRIFRTCRITRIPEALLVKVNGNPVKVNDLLQAGDQLTFYPGEGT